MAVLQLPWGVCTEMLNSALVMRFGGFFLLKKYPK